LIIAAKDIFTRKNMRASLSPHKFCFIDLDFHDFYFGLVHLMRIEMDQLQALINQKLDPKR